MTQAPGSVAEILSAARLIPVLTIERLDRAVPLARALVAGGVRTLEITLRTAAGGDAAAAIQAEVPDAIVGLGTVVRRADLELAQRLGCRSRSAPVRPRSCSTPRWNSACRSSRASARRRN